MSSPRPRTTVVVPTYGRPRFLARAVRSVQRQTFEQWELIVVDDNDPGSPERRETESTMGSFGSDERVRYVRHDRNRGGSQARNTGIEAARGAIVAFLDDDDEWRPEKLERQLERLDRDRLEPALVYTGFLFRYDDGRPDRPHPPKLRGDPLPAILADNVVGTTSTVACRTEALRAVGGFDPGLAAAQDHDLFVRLAAAGHRFDYVDAPLVILHRHGAGGITTQSDRFATYQQFDAKHALLLERYPHAHALRLETQAREHLVVGDRAAARRRAMAALRRTPWTPRLWAILALTLVGRRALSRLLRWRGTTPRFHVE